MDIGCYPITLSRMLFEAEPVRVIGLLDRDPEMRIDRLASALLDYPAGQCQFCCGTQLVAYQRMVLAGTGGRIEIEIPFNAPPDRPVRLLVDDGSSLFGAGIRVEEFPVCNQYTIQGDLFSRAILEDGREPTPLEDSIRNMAVIEALFRSAESGRWERPGLAG
jgi:predicted dehydrogenase